MKWLDYCWRRLRFHWSWPYPRPYFSELKNWNELRTLWWKKPLVSLQDFIGLATNQRNKLETSGLRRNSIKNSYPWNKFVMSCLCGNQRCTGPRVASGFQEFSGTSLWPVQCRALSYGSSLCTVHFETHFDIWMFRLVEAWAWASVLLDSCRSNPCACSKDEAMSM